MAERRIGIVMNGVTGRMGANQHLEHSVIAIRDQGGCVLRDGGRLVPDPILVGRNAQKLKALAKRFEVERWTTDLDAALADPADEVFFDAGLTNMRAAILKRAIAAGKHVYCEKPSASSLGDAIAVARLAQAAGIRNGAVQDKLFLPGLQKLARLCESGFFGRILSVRGDFGYWVFEGQGRAAQRPSWNYRAADGGGIILDMFCHWRYVLDNLFGEVRAVCCLGANHIPERVDEQGGKYVADADDAAYAMFELDGGVVATMNSSWCVRVRRDDLVEFQVDGTQGSAVAGLTRCFTQDRAGTPQPVWNPVEPQKADFFADWHEVTGSERYDNGFKVQWELFLRHVADGEAWPWTLAEAAKGVQLAELAIESWKRRRWLEVSALPGGSGGPGP